jgi:hypothetical protein
MIIGISKSLLLDTFDIFEGSYEFSGIYREI